MLVAKQGKIERIDFSDVPKEKRRRGQRLPEGTYLCKVVKGERGKSKNNNPQYVWDLQILQDAQGNKKYKGTTRRYYTSLNREALFNLRNLIMAVTGKNVAGKAVDFDPNKIIGKQVGIIVEHEEYEPEDGKPRLVDRIVDVISVDEIESEEEEDSDDDEDEEDEDDLDDVEDM